MEKINREQLREELKRAEQRFREYLQEQLTKIENPKANKNIDIQTAKLKVYEKCPFCNSNSFYSQKYDAYYCNECNIWLEPKCTDEGCQFCKNRPVRPI